MGTRFKHILAALFFAALVGLIPWGNHVALANDSTRQTSTTLSYIQYEWWLISWENDTILCQILIDHDGLPTSEEVAVSCGTALAKLWVELQHALIRILTRAARVFMCT